MRELLKQLQALMAVAASNVNEKDAFRVLRSHSNSLVEDVEILEPVGRLDESHNGLEGIKAFGMLGHPLESLKFGVVSFLEGCVAGASDVLVLCLRQEGWQTRNNRPVGIEAGKFEVV